MWKGKSAIEIFLIFSIMLFQMPGAFALDNKASASKSVKKKAVVKRTASAPKRTLAKKSVQAKRNQRKTVRHTARPTKKKVYAANRKRKVAHRSVRRVPSAVARAVVSAGNLAGLHRTHDPLNLHSNVAYVIDQSTSEVLFEKNSRVPLPIASLTKLMTGLVVVDFKQDMQEMLEVTSDDVDRLKNTSSRLPVGAKLSRADMLHIALMSSENRAASALGRNFPGGLKTFVTEMNMKAKSLGMTDTYYVEPTGLSNGNVASASDLAKLVKAASRYQVLRNYSTYDQHDVHFDGKALNYKNSNRLVGKDGWDIALQKTGYIREAGRCVVMQLTLDDRPVTMILLDAKSTYSRANDAGQMLSWIKKKFSREQTALAVNSNSKDQ